MWIKSLLSSRFLLLIFIFLFVLTVFVFVDYFNVEESIYFYLTGKRYYDLLFQENLNLGTVATLSAVLVALYSALKSIDLVNEQLRIEQTPLVVIENNIDVGGIGDSRSQGHNYMLVTFKNIGRGPAVRVTANLDRKNPDTSFFVNTESHSFELGSNTKSNARKIDDAKIKVRMFEENGNPIVINSKNPLKIHIHYKDQLGNWYHRVAKFFLEGDILKLMENKDYDK